MFNIKRPPVPQESTIWHQPLLFPTSKTIEECKMEFKRLERPKNKNIKLTLISENDERIEFYMTDGMTTHFWGVLTNGQKGSWFMAQ